MENLCLPLYAKLIPFINGIQVHKVNVLHVGFVTSRSFQCWTHSLQGKIQVQRNQISNSLPLMHHLSHQGWFLCSSQFPSSSSYLGVICLVVLTFCHYTCPALNNADCCTQPPTHWKVSYKLDAQKKRHFSLKTLLGYLGLYFHCKLPFSHGLLSQAP